MEKEIKRFLTIKKPFSNSNSGYGYGDGNGDGYGSGNGDGYGDGYGSGSGNGDGYGYGNGDGYGDGDGYGNGDGNGDGYGDGYGYGIKTINNQKIYIIDSIQTIITSIRKNIAQGFILNSDWTLTPCYIAKAEDLFSHGETIKQAVLSLQKKLLLNLPTEQRIIKFKEKFTSLTKKYKAIDYYEWHHFLTGSCDLGRKTFVSDKQINLEKDKFTVLEFIELTKNSYGSDVILQLKKEYKSF